MKENPSRLRLGLAIQLAALALVTLCFGLGLLMRGGTEALIMATPAIGWAGRALCLFGPASARVPLLLSLFLDAVTVALALLHSSWAGMVWLLSLLIYLVFLVQLARWLERRDVVGLARDVLVMTVLAFGCVIGSIAWVNPTTRLTIGMAGGLLMLFGWLRYIQVLARLRAEVEKREGEQDA